MNNCLESQHVPALNDVGNETLKNTDTHYVLISIKIETEPITVISWSPYGEDS